MVFGASLGASIFMFIMMVYALAIGYGEIGASFGLFGILNMIFAFSE